MAMFSVAKTLKKKAHESIRQHTARHIPAEPAQDLTVENLAEAEENYQWLTSATSASSINFPKAMDPVRSAFSRTNQNESNILQTHASAQLQHLAPTGSLSDQIDGSSPAPSGLQDSWPLGYQAGRDYPSSTAVASWIPDGFGSMHQAYPSQNNHNSHNMSNNSVADSHNNNSRHTYDRSTVKNYHNTSIYNYGYGHPALSSESQTIEVLKPNDGSAVVDSSLLTDGSNKALDKRYDLKTQKLDTMAAQLTLQDRTPEANITRTTTSRHSSSIPAINVVDAEPAEPLVATSSKTSGLDNKDQSLLSDSRSTHKFLVEFDKKYIPHSPGNVNAHIRSYMKSTMNQGFECPWADVPLWMPFLGYESSTGRMVRCVQVGDVGCFDRTGNFETLFNILLSAEENINEGLQPPENFQPFKYQLRKDTDIIRDGAHYEDQKFVFDTNGSEQNFPFTAREKHTTASAIAVIKGGTVVKLRVKDLNASKALDYFESQVNYWYRAARSTERSLKNGQLVLVTRAYMVRSWGILHYCHQMNRKLNPPLTAVLLRKPCSSSQTTDIDQYKWCITEGTGANLYMRLGSATQDLGDADTPTQCICVGAYSIIRKSRNVFSPALSTANGSTLSMASTALKRIRSLLWSRP